MGGLIAVNLALKHKVCGIITLSSQYIIGILKEYLSIMDDLKEGKYDSLKFYVGASYALPFSAMLNFKILCTKQKLYLNK